MSADIEKVVRKRHDGSWEVGVCVFSGSWKWLNLKARRKNTAEREAPAAWAKLLRGFAGHQEMVAADFTKRAAALRAEADKLAPPLPEPGKEEA